jgi:cell shape-determining protein MreC
MAEKKDKVIDRINVPVLGTAKRVLNEFQETGNYGSQSDALSDLLLNYRKLEERVKELEAELTKLKE